MENTLSISQLILNADIIVQIIMLILVIASIISWTLIFSKKTILAKEKIAIKYFTKKFHLKESVEDSYNINDKSFIASMFNEAKEELNLGANNGVERAYRKINIAVNNKIDALEDRLSVLAIIASSSPYIGLFGTVWGIMHSFLSLASVKQATISVVAPGIAEALIATAFGLFAAIPANIFYNKLTTEIEVIHNKYQKISEEFLIIMQRQYN